LLREDKSGKVADGRLSGHWCDVEMMLKAEMGMVSALSVEIQVV
jgi:hypothetical protein